MMQLIAIQFSQPKAYLAFTRDGHWDCCNCDLSVRVPGFITGDNDDSHKAIARWCVVRWDSSAEGIPDHAVDDIVLLAQELVATRTACWLGSCQSSKGLAPAVNSAPKQKHPRGSRTMTEKMLQSKLHLSDTRPGQACLHPACCISLGSGLAPFKPVHEVLFEHECSSVVSTRRYR